MAARRVSPRYTARGPVRLNGEAATSQILRVQQWRAVFCLLVSHFAWPHINYCVVPLRSSLQPHDAAAVHATDPHVDVDTSEHPTKRQKTNHPQMHSESSMASQATGPKQAALPPLPSYLAIGRGLGQE